MRQMTNDTQNGKRSNIKQKHYINHVSAHGPILELQH